MDDFSNRVRNVIQYSLYVISISLLGWAITEFKPFFAGLILGTSVSLINSIYTSRRIHRLSEIAISGQKKGGSTGMGFRFGTSALAGLFAVQYPETFHIVGTVVGLLTAQAIAFIDGAIYLLKSSIDRSGKG